MLSWRLARWVTETFEGVEAFSARHLDLVHAKDPTIFHAARSAQAVVLTKDDDFADEVRRAGAPPVVWVRSGNTTNEAMRTLLLAELPAALDAIRAGRLLVEIGAEAGGAGG